MISRVMRIVTAEFNLASIIFVPGKTQLLGLEKAYDLFFEGKAPENIIVEVPS